MRSGGLELAKLTCTRLENNLIRDRGDQVYSNPGPWIRLSTFMYVCQSADIIPVYFIAVRGLSINTKYSIVFATLSHYNWLLMFTLCQTTSVGQMSGRCITQQA